MPTIRGRPAAAAGSGFPENRSIATEARDRRDHGTPEIPDRRRPFIRIEAIPVNLHEDGTVDMRPFDSNLDRRRRATLARVLGAERMDRIDGGFRLNRAFHVHRPHRVAGRQARAEGKIGK